MTDAKGRPIWFRAKTPTYLLPVIAAVTTIGIFITDTLTGLEIAMPVFYTAVVLMCVGFLRGRGVVLISIGCVVLTLLSDVLTVGEGISATGVINTIISLLAIAITTFLA